MCNIFISYNSIGSIAQNFALKNVKLAETQQIDILLYNKGCHKNMF